MIGHSEARWQCGEVMVEGIKICDGAGMLDVFSTSQGLPARHRAAGRKTADARVLYYVVDARPL